MIVVLASARPGSAQVFDYVSPANIDTPIPGGTGNFTIVGQPSIDDGIIAFRGFDSDDQQGIYTSEASVVRLIVDRNTPVPGGTGTFLDYEFTTPSIDDGYVTFRATGPSGEAGIYISGNGVVSQVANLTTRVPPVPDTFTNFSAPWTCDGNVVFRATRSGGQDGIYTNAGGTLRTVADTTTAIPDGTGTFTSFGGINQGNLRAFPTMDNHIAFYGTGVGQAGIYAEIAGGLTKIADLTDFPAGFGDPTVAANISAGGKVVFISGDAIHQENRGPIIRVVGPGDIVANTGETLDSVTLQGLSFDRGWQAVGNVSFLGQADGSFVPRVFTVQGGTLLQVIHGQDKIEGRPVGGNLGAYSQSLEDDLVTFLGSYGNWVAMREYQWHGQQSGNWDDATNWRVGRTPRDVVPTKIIPDVGGTTITGPEAATTLVSLDLDTNGPGRTTLELLEGVPLSVGGITTIGAGGRLAGDGVFNAGADLVNSGEIDLGTGSLTIIGETLTNLGVLRGNGEIANPIINASPNGEIRLAAGQRQHWSDSSDHLSDSHIEVLGNRGSSQGAAELDINAQLTNIAGGDIIARDATLRFRGGLANGGRLLFSGGLNDVFGPVNLTGGAGGGEVIVSGQGTATFYGPVDHNGDEIRVSAGSTLVFFGDLSGAGPITCTGGSPGLSCPGNVFIEAGFFPGNSPAAVFIGPSVSLGADALLEMELGGVAPGSEHDQLNIGGTATLSGTLDIQMIDGFTPRVGDSFTILTFGERSGTFDAVTSMKGYVWNVDYAADAITITATAVPEPATWLLAATGLAGIGLSVRKWRPAHRRFPLRTKTFASKRP